MCIQIYLSEMAKNELKLSTMFGENFEIYFSEMAKNGLRLYGVVGIAFYADIWYYGIRGIGN